MRNGSEVPVDGYEAEHIDFATVHNALAPLLRQAIDDMIEAAVVAESDPGGSNFSFIRIAGHSDRVDTPGLSSEARRAKELEASDLRAQAAQAFFFDEISNRLLAGGFTAPADLGSMQNVFIDIVACGAADLIHLVPNGESQRRENRRVVILSLNFEPGNPA